MLPVHMRIPFPNFVILNYVFIDYTNYHEDTQTYLYSYDKYYPLCYIV